MPTRGRNFLARRNSGAAHFARLDNIRREEAAAKAEKLKKENVELKRQLKGKTTDA